jgi:GntR family transcriptional regulator of arabinose operon
VHHSNERTVTGLKAEKPKYRILMEYLTGLITGGKLSAGNKIPSENELAEQFQISRHTVRKSIGELVSEGWLASSQGKGTFVRDSRKNRQSRIIGIVTTYLGDYIFPSIIRGMDEVLGNNGYNIVLGHTGNHFEKEKTCLANLLNQNIDGLIAETTKSALPNPNMDLYRAFEEQGIPILFMHGSYKGFKASSIYEDDTLAGYLATKHLIDLGHEKIGGIFKMDDIQGHARYEGFVKAHREAGLAIADRRIAWFDTHDVQFKLETPPNPYIEGFLSDCTGIVCYNDQVSLGIIDIARMKGIAIPGQLSMVSFDDSDLAVASDVKLTTVAHPKEKLGMEAAELMMKMIEEPHRRFDVKMKPQLVVRSSTGPAAKPEGT